MSFLNNPSRISENYGVRIAIGLILFFFAMKVFDLSHVVELRFLNLVILTIGVYYALRNFRKGHEGHLNYFRGLIVGVSTAGIGSLIFAIFLFTYMQMDIELMQSIRDHEPMGRFLNPYMASFIVLLEGFFSGFLVTFVLLNWIATDEVNVPQS